MQESGGWELWVVCLICALVGATATALLGDIVDNAVCLVAGGLAGFALACILVAAGRG